MIEDDPMDISGGDNRSHSTERPGEHALSTENPKPFRINSLLMATFPWSTSIPMAPSKLVENIGENPESNDAFVCNSLTNLARTY